MVGDFDRRLAADKRSRNILAATGLTLALLAPLHLEAEPTSYDLRKVAMLPSYCKYTQSFRKYVPGANNPAEIERWKTLMGETFNHLHHYCWGLMATNQANFSARGWRARTAELNYSIQQFDYVIRNATPGFILLPEIFTKKGENLIRLDKGPQGIVELQRAIELKPEYGPAYAHLSDYYKDAGNPKKAREWLEKGLLAAPDANALKRRLAELDGAKSKR